MLYPPYDPMETSMEDAIQAYYDAMHARNRIHFKMEFLAANEIGTVLTDDDIDISTGVTITDSFNGDTDLKMGKVVCKQLSTRIILSEKTASINWTNPFRVYFGVEDGNDGIIWIDFGKFIGKRPKNVSTVDAIDFIAYDIATAFEESADEFIDDLALPATVSDMIDMISDELDIPIVDQDGLATMSARRFTNNHFKNDSYIFRDILGNIAEGLGCYARAMPSLLGPGVDAIAIKWFSNDIQLYKPPVPRDEQFYEEHADLYAGMSWNDFENYHWAVADTMIWDDVTGYYKNRNAFDGIVVSKVSSGVTGKYPSKCKGHLYKIQDNPIMIITSTNKTTHINNYVKPLYNDRINSLGGVLPMTIECYGDLLVQAGDIIQVELPEGVVEMPIYYKTIRWNGILVDKYETTAPES